MTTAKKKVLVVDDDNSLRMALKAFLEAKNYEVLAAGDGREGLAFVVRWQPDLILMDINMPRLDGIQAVEFLRYIHNSVPVIFISSEAVRKNVVEAAGFAADDFVRKPFELTDLGSRIELQLLKLTESDLPNLANILTPINLDSKQVPTEKIIPGWKAFIGSYHGLPVFAQVNTTTKSYNPKDLSPAQYAKDLVIWGSYPKGWRKMWPTTDNSQSTVRKVKG